MTHPRTRIKFCGFTRAEDADAACRLGVDAIGLVLTRKSKRFPGLERAREIRRALPPFVTCVALFMDDEIGFVSEAIATVAPDLLQFHGSERAADCVRYGRPYMKAVAMGGGQDWHAVVAEHRDARAILFDGHAAGEQGGGGKRFDWSLLAGRTPGESAVRIVLAGGLTDATVNDAVRAVRPYAVDVSSGIESAPGIKDTMKMERFIAAVRAADEAV